MTEPLLAVATSHAAHLLPLASVVELTDMLPVGPGPADLPLLAGLAIHRDETLPVYSLDVVLGEAAHSGRSWEDRDWGGFVIARVGERCVALGVRWIVGLVREADRPPLDLPTLLAPILPAYALAPPVDLPAPVPTSRYLVAGIGGRRCALPVTAVERVLEPCRVVRAPCARGTALIGVGTIEGRVLPVIDLRRLLGCPEAAPIAGHVVVATADVGRLILAVDQVFGLHDLADDALDLPPDGAPHSIFAVTRDGGTWVLSPSLIAPCLLEPVAQP